MRKVKEDKQEEVILEVTEETQVGDYVLEPGDKVKVLTEMIPSNTGVRVGFLPSDMDEVYDLLDDYAEDWERAGNQRGYKILSIDFRSDDARMEFFGDIGMMDYIMPDYE
jgi:hypothetical protein